MTPYQLLHDQLQNNSVVHKILGIHIFLGNRCCFSSQRWEAAGLDCALSVEQVGRGCQMSARGRSLDVSVCHHSGSRCVSLNGGRSGFRNAKTDL